MRQAASPPPPPPQPVPSSHPVRAILTQYRPVSDRRVLQKVGSLLAAVHATLIPRQEPRDGQTQRGESKRLGLTAGYFRGRVDSVIGRFSDLLFAFPSFFMIIALSIPMVERVESLGIVRDNGARLTVLIIFFVFFAIFFFISSIFLSL